MPMRSERRCSPRLPSFAATATSSVWPSRVSPSTRSRSSSKEQPIPRRIHERTDGNPFFVREARTPPGRAARRGRRRAGERERRGAGTRRPALAQECRSADGRIRARSVVRALGARAAAGRRRPPRRTGRGVSRRPGRRRRERPLSLRARSDARRRLRVDRARPPRRAPPPRRSRARGRARSRARAGAGDRSPSTSAKAHGPRTSSGRSSWPSAQPPGRSNETPTNRL